MLTRRQRMILDAIRAAHAAGFHPSPARLAERIELGGRQAMRADVGRLIVDGEIVGVVDNSGSETTRASGVTPDGATEHTLRIEVREAGTIVRFYLDNAQVGADVTTNIPTGVLYALCGLRNNTASSVTMNTADWFGWREI